MTESAHKLRVLVIDDSAFNRRALSDMLESAGDIAVVGKAADGEDGLRCALEQRPDVITLDLDMPHIDGFAFLRLLMARAPTPVIVISSYARSAEVFKALDLGAFDFIAKPSRDASWKITGIREELLVKVRGVRELRRDALRPRPIVPAVREAPDGPLRLVLVGASTGGPPAVERLVAALPADLPVAVLVAQHMPEGFTRAFAERLCRTTRREVVEAADGERVLPGKVLVAPGGRHMTLVADGADLRVVVFEKPGAKYCPSIDALFESASRIASTVPTLGVVLTGMGSDGRVGIKLLRDAGATTFAESEDSAAIFGMPREAIAGGGVGQVLPLGQIAAALVRFGRGRGS